MSAGKSCNCGWSGNDCSIKLVTEPLNVTCRADTSVCSIGLNTNGYNVSTCKCNCGTWGGEACDEFKVMTWNAIICALFAGSLLVLFISWIILRNKRSNREKLGMHMSEWEKVPGIAAYHPNTILPDYPIIGLIYRLGILAFGAAIIIRQLIGSKGTSLYFFTVWNFGLICLYFLLATFNSIHGMITERNAKSGDLVVKSEATPEDKKSNPVSVAPANFFQLAQYIVLEVELPGALLVDVITWAVLFPAYGRGLLNETSFIQHISNLFILSFDFVFFTRFSFAPFHVMLFLIWIAVYALFQVIQISLGGCPAYFFLDLSQPFTIVWFIGVLLISMLFYFIVAVISWKCSCCLGKRYHVDDDIPAEIEAPSGTIDFLFCVTCKRKTICGRCKPPHQPNQFVPQNDLE